MTSFRKGLPVGLAGLVLAVPAAQATDQVVANPAPGVTSVFVSDQAEAGKVVIRTTTPVAPGHFSSMFVDVDADGDSDRAIVAVKESDGGAVHIRSTFGSTTSCQQYGGTSASPVPGASGTFATNGSGWTAKIPATFLAGSFRWKITATSPGSDGVCGGTDDSVRGLAFGLGDAHIFAAGSPPPADTTAPAVPSGLTGTAGDAAAAIDWADNTDPDLAHYLVYRQRAGGSFTLIAEPGRSKVDDKNLSNGSPYTYYVKAVDKTGNVSPESPKVTVTPKAPEVVVPRDVGEGEGERVQPPRAQPEPSPVLAVRPAPVGTKMVASIGNTQLLSSSRPADLPRFDLRTGRVVLGLLFNADPVPSTTRATFVVRVPKATRSRRAAASASASASRCRTVTVGTSTVKLRPGQALPLSFTFNKVGRKLTQRRTLLKVTARLRIAPRGLAARQGSLSITVKKKSTGKRQPAVKKQPRAKKQPARTGC